MQINFWKIASNKNNRPTRAEKNSSRDTLISFYLLNETLSGLLIFVFIRRIYMRCLILLFCLISQFSLAATLYDAVWEPKTKSVYLTMAFQGGCLKHVFTVAWDKCADDGSRFGQIHDSGGDDICLDNVIQSFRAYEPNDGCVANALYLKSSSSTNPNFVPKQ